MKYNTYIIIGVAILLFIGGTWWSKTLTERDPTILSQNGLHWHPTLAIYIDGEQVDIPSGIGLAGGPAPIHTHNDVTDARETGGRIIAGHKPLHMEFGGVVRPNDARLGNFFTIWGKEFNSECVLDRCTSIDGGMVTMMVNGEVNTEYENYIMRDNDRIEIFYQGPASSGEETTSLGVPAPGVDPNTVDEMIVNSDSNNFEE